MQGQISGESGIIDFASHQAPQQSPTSVIHNDLHPTDISGGLQCGSQDREGLSMADHSPVRMPPLSGKRRIHYPTPQSPNTFAQYVPGHSHGAGSPLHQSSLSDTTALSNLTPSESARHKSKFHHQFITPESSPYSSRVDTQDAMTSSGSSLQIGDALIKSELAFVPAPHIPDSPHSPPSDPHSSTLSSPFMVKTPLAGDRRARSSTPLSLPSSSALLPSAHPEFQYPPRNPGGEIDRIRQAMREGQLAHLQEAESRRPEYLKRTKRTFSDADLQATEREHSSERAPAVGVVESPHKGRRLKLFQETSEESFEESLMAGGYGLYRTADWVRQPQPLPFPSPAVPGPSNVVAALEEAPEAPPTEREIRKRKRLEAFQADTPPGGRPNKLVAVEMDGKGRVLLDMPNESQTLPSVPETPPPKRRGGNRRKKKGGDSQAASANAAAAMAAQVLPTPNWPDSEFPWRVRTEERAELARIQDAERLKWIERFLDRDSDDEDEDSRESSPQPDLAGPIERKEGVINFRRGRGKMVPLSVMPDSVRDEAGRRRSLMIPSDPADARAALLSKKSVRALSYRQRRRQREADEDSDEEVVCICNGRDDGRELVQCDACEQWYHLQCIGISNITDLGKEEDPWFCRDCTRGSRSPLSDPDARSSEPVFVPTEEHTPTTRLYEAPFFQPSVFHDSPGTWSAPRSGRGGNTEHDGNFSSGSSSWVYSSRPGPSTPRDTHPSVRVHAVNTPRSLGIHGRMDDESPFDPASTPSRGVGAQTSFTTPKNSPWLLRTNLLFQTPSRSSGRDRPFGGPNSLSLLLDESGGRESPLGRRSRYNDSPLGRRLGDGFRTRRIPDSPLLSRSTLAPPDFLEDSPIMRSKGKQH
ncbi:hypothetical protein BD779DRAFT_1560368 [Infundibulicybe gibba]|nr:hypothetical protein BD779DRAFT_1560368 [Infundibulicybe gibba]